MAKPTLSLFFKLFVVFSVLLIIPFLSPANAASTYTWHPLGDMGLSGTRSQFKGIGTLNGEGEYKFMIWAGDGTGTDGADTFRIKIWAEDGEAVIYDNGFESSAFENGRPINGGSIVVHTKQPPAP